MCQLAITVKIMASGKGKEDLNKSPLQAWVKDEDEESKDKQMALPQKVKKGSEPKQSNGVLEDELKDHEDVEGV